MIQKIVQYGLTLFIISSIVALALALVNQHTSLIIDTREQAEQTESRGRLTIDFDTETQITEYILEYKKNAEPVAYGVLIQEPGYEGDIGIMVLVDMNLNIEEVKILHQNETPGLGAKIIKEDFLSQYIGKTSEIQLVKGAATGNEVSAISGATISSRAVTDAANRALMEISPYINAHNEKKGDDNNGEEENPGSIEEWVD